MNSTVLLFCLIGLAYSADWGYDDSNDAGPSNWKKDFPKCGGKSQSPIDIATANVEYSDDLPNIEFGDNWDMLLYDTNLTLLNNGHTVVANIKGPRPITTRQGDKTWKLAQFHLHWGQNSKTGSEHTIDGKYYPGEIHFVHYQSTYADIGEALPNPDGLMVLGFFIKIDDIALMPSTLQLIFRFFDDIKYKGEEKKLFTIRRSLYDIFHSKSTSKYYHYPGSLTTPSCDESVTWNVMHPENGFTITTSMMEKLRSLTQTEKSLIPLLIKGNYRPVLPLNGRVVKRNFDKSSASIIGSLISLLIPILVIAVRLFH